jgi:hypothetical protein
MPRLLEEARDLGRAIAVGRSALPELALRAARAAATGEINEEDAATVYAAYLRQAQHITKPDMGLATLRAQVSKLRQIIKLGVERRREALKLFERVRELHVKCSHDDHVQALYPCYVGAARLQLLQTKPLTDHQIMAVCTQRAGRTVSTRYSRKR